MADTHGELVMKAMVDALNAPVVKPCATYRTRVDAFAAGELPAQVLYAVDEQFERASQNYSIHKRTVRLECLVEAPEPPADINIDPLIAYSVQTLYANNAFGDLILGMNVQRIQWEAEASYEAVAIAAVDFEVAFRTKVDDLTVRV